MHDLTKDPWLIKNLIHDSSVKGRDSGKDFSQKAIQPSPEMFDRIAFRGVGWKKENSAPGIICPHF